MGLRFTEFLAKWKGDATNVECGLRLDIDGATFATWLTGLRRPPGNRRPAVAGRLGISLADLESLIAADRVAAAERTAAQADPSAQMQLFSDQNIKPAPVEASTAPAPTVAAPSGAVVNGGEEVREWERAQKRYDHNDTFMSG